MHGPKRTGRFRLWRIRRGMALTAAMAGLAAGTVTALPAGADTPHDPVSSAPITTADLLNGGQPVSLTDNARFTPPAHARPAAPFQGRLTVSGATMNMSKDFTTKRVLDKDTTAFPGFSMRFFTQYGDLVPADQDVVTVGGRPGTRTFWDVIVSPGRVWSQPGDHGWQRASFPFSLVNQIEGETHNGVATFAYRGRHVSHVRYQIVQETGPYLVTDYFNAWGSLNATYRPGRVPGLAALRARHAADMTGRLPSASWSRLRGTAGSTLDGFNGAVPGRDVVADAVVHHGVLYRNSCPTVAGPLPYCGRQRFGVWSMTKSSANAMALLRLARKYGDGMLNEPIARYLRAADRPGWRDVTFGDLANMASGHGLGSRSAKPADIGSGELDDYERWYTARPEDTKVAEALDYPRYPWKPGEVARYRDQDMFLLGAAMTEYLRAKTGTRQTIWDLLEREVYRPIGIQYAPTNRTLEDDGGTGQPIMAFGYYPSLDDLAKISGLVHAGGRHNGRQILSPRLTREALSAHGAGGLRTGRVAHGLPERYQRTWWRQPIAADGCRRYVPTMTGWGGNLVAVLPGGDTGIRIATVSSETDETHAADGMAAVGAKLSPGSYCG